MHGSVILCFFLVFRLNWTQLQQTRKIWADVVEHIYAYNMVRTYK